MPQIVIVGCGFLGEIAADFFDAAGWDVLGLCASADSANRLAARPYEVRAVDITRPMVPDPAWRGVKALVHCASSGGGGVDAYRAVYRDGLRNVLTTFQPRRVLFTGSTSVYGQCDGSWVDERSETKPERETARILLEAESMALASGGFVARLSGLYGPGRSVLRRKFLAGEAVIEGDGGRWINQIHRDDAARAIFHLFASRVPAGIYNVSDDVPATQREIFQWLAEATGRPLPPAGEAASASKRARTSKRVSNAKLRTSGWAPRFASYRNALAAPDAL